MMFMDRTQMNRFWSDSMDPRKERPEVHHVEEAFVETLQYASRFFFHARHLWKNCFFNQLDV